jgi:CheY-like chemotaxis protein
MGVKSSAVDRRPIIMVADDDPKELERSARVLENSGYRVVSATDGRTALQEALTRRVDLIIMDVSIPHLSGVETCHCLKAMPKTQKIPVVLTAAKKDPAAKALAERTQGSVRVLRKPFTDESLLSIVRQLARPKTLI